MKCSQVRLGRFSSASLKQKFQLTWPLRAKGGRGWVISQPPSCENSSWPVHLGPHGATLGLEWSAAWLLAAPPPLMATSLLFIYLGSPKISKNWRMGSKSFRVGYLLVLIGILIWGPALRQAPTAPTRLLTRLFQEVWFPGHACHAFLASLFTSLFAGKREVTPVGAQSAASVGGHLNEMLTGKAGPFFIGLP